MKSKKALAAAVWIGMPLTALVTQAMVRPAPAGAAQSTEAGQANAASGSVDHQKLYAEKCSACHNLPNPQELSYTRPEWQRVVNKMLVRYKASEEISPTEAGQIVDYLATFAPKRDNAGQPGNRGGGTSNPSWDAEPTDVWSTIATKTTVDNFEAPGGLSSFTQVGSNSGTPAWTRIRLTPALDGSTARVYNAGARSTSSTLLIDPKVSGTDIDVKVKFKVVSGVNARAIGIAFGVQNGRRYDLVRFDQNSNDLTLLQSGDDLQSTLQRTPVQPSGGAQTTAFAWHPADWHTLRVQVQSGRVRAWIDSYKRINAPLPGYTGGAVALWSQADTKALFDDWTTDVYDAAPSTAS